MDDSILEAAVTSSLELAEAIALEIDRYVRACATEFERSIGDYRCLRHHHDGNPCKRCGFIRIEAVADGDNAK
jgi:hypothetical protein